MAWAQSELIVWSVPGEQEIASSQKWNLLPLIFLEISTVAETATFVNTINQSECEMPISIYLSRSRKNIVHTPCFFQGLLKSEYLFDVV